jgi:cytochrome c biogenesis protein CcmG, thiol:disulfide interchange protein DsbE
MRRRSSFVIALLVFAAGACTAAPDSGEQPTAMAPATTTSARASTAMNRPTRYAPPGLLPVSRRKPAPALGVTAFDGRTVSLDGLRGRPVVVSFFESWCGTCQAEQPDLTKVAGDFAGRVGFVGVSHRDTVAAGRAYQRRFKVPYPLANDPSGRTWARWGVPYQPVVVLVDKHGRIAERFDGGTTGGTLAVALAYLLGE